MSVFNSEFSRAITVYKSENADVPYPEPIATGTNTSTAVNQLINTSGGFVAAVVAPGDIVYNTTDGTAATVVSVTSATTLVLNADIFTATSKAYIVYQNSAFTGMPNPGCMLYIGGAGNISVTTIGGDTVLFSGVPAGTILPVQVRRINSTTGGTTTATLINALW